MSSESWDLVGAWYKFVEKETEGAQPQSPSGKPPLPSRQSLLTPFWLSVSTHPSHGLNGPCAPNSNPPGDVLGDGALGRCLGHEGIRALMNGISALIKEMSESSFVLSPGEDTAKRRSSGSQEAELTSP